MRIRTDYMDLAWFAGTYLSRRVLLSRSDLLEPTGAHVPYEWSASCGCSRSPHSALVPRSNLLCGLQGFSSTSSATASTTHLTLLRTQRREGQLPGRPQYVPPGPCARLTRLLAYKN
jgi:hypothetical protein